MQAYDYKLLIREFHLDTFGHVNNATYLAIYEEARWDLITKNGYGLKEIQKSGKSPIIMEVNLKFQKEIRLRETITVKTELIKYEGKVGILKQTMVKESGDQASEALFTFGLFDLATRKLIEPTPEWNRAIGRT